MDFTIPADLEKRNTEMNRLVKETTARSHHSSMPEHDEYEFRPSQAWIHSKKTDAESLDFEETESVMWRKVNHFICIFICIFIYLFHSTLLIIASITSILSRSWTLVDHSKKNHCMEMGINRLDWYYHWSHGLFRSILYCSID